MSEKEPYVIDVDLSNFLKEYVKCLVPKRRKILLVFDTFETNELYPNMKPIGNDTRSPPYFILLAIRIIEDYLYQPIGVIFHYENTSSLKIANCIRAFIADLTNCSFKVIATVSSTKKLLTPIVHSLVKRDPFSKKVTIHLYDVDEVKNIVHLYDSSDLLVDTQEIFLNSNIYFLYKKRNCFVDYKKTLTRKENTSYDVIYNILQFDTKKRNLATALKLFSEATCLELKITIPDDSHDCVKFLLLIDQLYDSLNAYEMDTMKYRTKVCKNSKHFNLWNDAVFAFESMIIRPFDTSDEKNKSKKIDRKTYGNKENNKNVDNEKKSCNDEFRNHVLVQQLLQTLIRHNEENDIDIINNQGHPIIIEQWIVTLKGVKYLCEELLKRYKWIETKCLSVNILRDCILRMRFGTNVEISRDIGGPSTKLINDTYFNVSFDVCSCVTLY